MSPNWPGVISEGSYAEYIYVPSYRFLVKAEGLDPKEVAPLTDAGLTPYRAVKKVRHLLNPDSYALVIGSGGLACYAIQYLKLLSPANVVTVVRNEDKVKLTKEMGSDFVINSSSSDIVSETKKITSQKGIDVAIDFVASNDTLTAALSTLKRFGSLVLVGLMGKFFNLPTIESVLGEFNIIGSLWGNYNELREVIGLAETNKLKTPIRPYRLEQVMRP